MPEHMLNEQTKGVFVIAATPFSDDGSIDLQSVDSLVEFYIQKGVHGITLLGMMGEAHKLTFAESSSLVQHVLKRVDGRVPVVVGVSNSSLETMRNLTAVGRDHGAAGVLVAPVSGLRTDDQIFAYYQAVFQALGSSVPVIYQDYPPTTGVYLSATLFIKMVPACPRLVMLKLEDCPALDKLSRIRAAERHGLRRVSILVGNGGFHFPQALWRGADGVMTGFAYPDMLVQVYERFVAGDREGAEDLFDHYAPLVCYEQQPGYGLAVRKEILRRRGAIRSSKVRVPGPKLTDLDREEIDRLLRRLERKLGG